MIFPSFTKKKQKVILYRFCLNQHENMLFSQFLMIFPGFIKKAKSNFFPISSRICLILSELAWKLAFLTISDDFSQFHQKKQKVYFSGFLAKLSWLCLNQHENMLFSRFLMIFPSFIKKKQKVYFSRFLAKLSWLWSARKHAFLTIFDDFSRFHQKSKK